MFPFRFPELIIMLVIGLIYLIPLAAGVWAIVTLQRIRSGQEVIRLRLEGLERLLQRSADH